MITGLGRIAGRIARLGSKGWAGIDDRSLADDDRNVLIVIHFSVSALCNPNLASLYYFYIYIPPVV